MISSGILDSKFTGIYTSTDTHELFTFIYQRICELEDMRIIEKLARPTSRQGKAKLMSQVNRRLKEVRTTMDQIYSLCSLLKNKEDAMVKEIFVTAQSWKSGIRKIQTKISNFYQFKMKYFSAINSCSKLGLKLMEVEEKQWVKECFSKMTGIFCICG